MVKSLSKHIIIVAAGSGSRFGSPLPKQFCLLSGQPVIFHAIDSLFRAYPDADLTIVISQSEENRFIGLCQEFGRDVPRYVFGGATRWESVRNGLATVDDSTALVLVHDGARPFPGHDMLLGLINAFENESVDGAIPAIPVTDSLRRVEPDGTSCQIDRAPFRAVQTPQAFRTPQLKAAYCLPYQPEFTDDASVMESAGFSNIVLVPGDTSNIKITNPKDILIAQALR